MDVDEPEYRHSKHMMQSWSFSLLLHLSVVFAAVTAMPNLTIVLDQEPFKWDVALVDRPQEIVRQDTPAPAPNVRPPQPVRSEPVRQVETASESVIPRVAPQQSAQVVHPVIEPPKPQPIQPVQEVVQVQPEPIPQENKKPEIKAPPPVIKEVAKQEPVSEPVKEPVREAAQTIEPVAPAYTYQAPAPAAAAPAAEPQKEPVSVASAPPAAVADPAPSRLPSSSAVSAPQPLEERPAPAMAPPAPAAPAEAPAQVAKAAPQTAPPVSDTKADHRWVGESLWRRVAELKRYPSAARLNGLEGRVVLKAVIRADGNLAEVSVVKSSGHAVLDAAAMEAVKLACPLHMKHPIGPPQIVVSLPISYSLAN